MGSEMQTELDGVSERKITMQDKTGRRGRMRRGNANCCTLRGHEMGQKVAAGCCACSCCPCSSVAYVAHHSMSMAAEPRMLPRPRGALRTAPPSACIQKVEQDEG